MGNVWKDLRLVWEAVVALGLLSLASSVWPQASILQNRNDLAGTGANLQETTLTASNVSVNTFGRLFSYPVDGEIVAQPLYVPNVDIPAQGRHNVIYVATMRNILYAFDADNPAAGAAGKLWGVDFNQRAGNNAAPFKATDVTGLHSENFPVSIGILSTPVIDVVTRTMYLVVSTSERGAKVMRLHAVDISTGNARPGSPVTIRGTYVSGTTSATFNPEAHNQRAALVLAGGDVIIAFASHDDIIPYRGWVMAYDKNSLQQTGVFAAVTAGGAYGGGIWQSGRAPAVDGQGRVYLSTGNGFGSNGYDGVNNFSESILCLDPARGLQLVDWFTPGNWSSLDSRDLDLGGSGPMLIPQTALLAAGGKEGVLYIVDTTNMGKFVSDDSQIVQKQKIVAGGHIMNGPVVWDRSASGAVMILYSSGENQGLRTYSFDGRRISASAIAKSLESNSGHPGAMLSLSANGATPGTGIIWSYARGQAIPANGGAGVREILPGVLRAYDAENVARLLWANQLNAGRDDAGLFGKFSVPSVVNGKVYLGTWSDQLVVYGLLPTNPDFLLTAKPARVAALGGVANYKVGLVRLNNYAEPVSYRVQSLPAGATASFVGPNPDGTMTLRVQLGSVITPGTFRINITARGQTKVHTQAVLLTMADAVTIPHEDWKIQYVDSEDLSTNNGGPSAIDGAHDTIWHTQSAPASPQPHEIQIDLGAVYNIAGFSYLPRQDNVSDSTIRKFEAYVSLDGLSWGQVVHDGSFDYPFGSLGQKQSILFLRPKPGRYFRLRSLFEVSFQPAASAAELDIFASSQSPAPPNDAELVAPFKGGDNAAWIKVYSKGEWSSWHSVAGQILDDPIAVASPNGQWDLFALGMDHSAWTQTNTGAGWLGWISLGGRLASRPVAMALGNGRIDLLAQGSDGAVWTRSRVNGNWTSWTSTGGCASSAPVMVGGSNARVSAFVRGCDNAVWTATLGAAGWSGWSTLGGTATADVSAVVSPSGQIYLFVIGPSQTVFSLSQLPSGAWGTWQSLGPSVIGTFVSPLILPGGDVAVFALGSDKKVWSDTLDHIGGRWSGWQPVQLYNYWTLPAPTFADAPRAMISAEGDVLLVGRTIGGQIWESRMAYGQWIGWVPSN